jgi:hypothetical protein
MPRETDETRLALLLRILTDRASNVVLLRERALRGSDEPDDLGLDKLFGPEMSDVEKQRRIRLALAAFLREGGAPNWVEYTYPDADPETIYEFRLEFEGQRLHVKTQLADDDPTDPILIIRSVKRRN